MKIYTYLGRKNISGERIYAARMALKLSQSELAARMQINCVTLEREAISKIETGKRLVADYAVNGHTYQPGAEKSKKGAGKNKYHGSCHIDIIAFQLFFQKFKFSVFHIPSL